MILSKYVKNNMYRLPPHIIKKNQFNPLLSSLYIVSTGILDGEHTNRHYVDRYFDCEFIMIYCIDGKGWTKIPSGKDVLVSQGDLLFCFDKSIQNYRADNDNPWTIMWARFHGLDAKLHLDNINITPEKPVLHIGNNERINILFNEIMLIMERGFANNHIVHASNILRCILGYLSIIKSEINQIKNEPAINRIVDYMTKNIDKSLKLNVLSKMFGISKDYLIRYFKKQTGHTPLDYFINLKMQKACRLVITTNNSINDIACALGFKDVYYFSRLFKKRIGLSPCEYRKIYKY